jgi:hypothetical protein
MKKSAILFSLCLMSLSVFAYNPSIDSPLPKSSQIANAQEMEVQQVIDDWTSEKNMVISSIPEKCKIVILDSNFKTVREECVGKMQNICDHSTLVPIIYRSEFIVKIGQVSYFMLSKK